MRSVESSHDTNSTQRRSVQSVKDTTRGGSRTRGARHPGLDLLAGALSSGSEPPSGRPKCRTREPSGRTRRRRRKKRSSREKAKNPCSPLLPHLRASLADAYERSANTQRGLTCPRCCACQAYSPSRIFSRFSFTRSYRKRPGKREVEVLCVPRC